MELKMGGGGVRRGKDTRERSDTIFLFFVFNFPFLAKDNIFFSRIFFFFFFFVCFFFFFFLFACSPRTTNI